MNNFSNIVDPTAKILKDYYNQHDLMLKSITSALEQFNKTLSENIVPVSKSVQASLPNTLQLLSYKINEMQKQYKIISGFEFLYADNIISTFDFLMKSISKSLNSIDYGECTEEEKELLTSSNIEVNELKQELNASNKKRLTFEQWLSILAFIVSLISLIKDFLPDEDIQQLTTEVQTISNSFEDYAHKNLENQNNILEILTNNQCDSISGD